MPHTGDGCCAEVLIDAGASLEATDEHGNTPLHAAGRRAHAKLFQRLVDAGADPQATNARGKPPKLLDESAAECTVM